MEQTPKISPASEVMLNINHLLKFRFSEDKVKFTFTEEYIDGGINFSPDIPHNLMVNPDLVLVHFNSIENPHSLIDYLDHRLCILMTIRATAINKVKQ